MTFKPGDVGQRFEISVYDSRAQKRIVVAWCDGQPHSDILAASFETRPGWSDAKVLDREAKK